MKHAISILTIVCFHVIVQAQYNVKDLGAKGNGTVLDTRAIQAAIDKAYANKGGVVQVPAGTYKIGTLILKDNVELHLQHGAVLLGSPDYKDYLPVKQQLYSRTKDLYAKYFMIFAEGANNIAITGSGTIHGNGLQHFQEERPQNLRPYMIRFANCTNVTVRDVHLLEAANWTFHLLACKDVNVDGVVIENRGEGNRDGLDIDACTRVTVANSRFSTTDDAIVMKATNDTLCQDITITNCLFREIGGSALKTGTESNGGFKNITVSNCVIKDIDVHAGIELMTVDGGMMQNILFENIVMDNVATPFFIRLGIRARPYKPGQYVNRIDDVRDIQLNNISAVNVKLPSSIVGLHSKKISNVSITNYTARYSAKQDAIAFNKVPFLEFDYPAAVMFRNLPAFGLYCRSVDGLHLQNINLYSADGDKRPAITLDRTDHVSIFTAKAPLIHLRNVNDITVAYSGSPEGSIETEETSVRDLRLSGNIKQKNVPLLADAAFDDVETSSKYSSSMSLRTPQDGSLQLCLLASNTSSAPAKVTVRYEGITQEFFIDWKEWGWAPITLLKQYKKGTEVKFDISTGPGINISKVYLRHQDIGFTD